MSPQFWQGVLAATGGWLAMSLTSCAALAWFVHRGRAREDVRRALES